MRYLPLRQRLKLFALGATLLVAAVGAFAFWSSHRIAGDMGAMQSLRVKPLVALDRVGRALERQHSMVLATLASTNDVMQEELAKRAAADRRDIPPVLAAIARDERDVRARELLARLAAAVDEAQGPALAAVIEQLQKGRFAEADIESQRLYQPRMREVSAMLDRVIDAQVALSAAEYERALSGVRSQGVAAIAATVAALAGGLAFAILIGNALHAILGAREQVLADGAGELARGRLDHRIAVAAGGDASIAARLNAMAEGFARLVRQVSGAASESADAAHVLARESRDLSLRTSAQAAGIEETAASMQQLSAAVGRSADLAGEARELAERASAAAREGGATMADVESTMRELAESERRVAEIVGTIDAIAFQTNILALNAAVEAARAGHDGRGFAVVAGEVRSLSQRSAAAAQEIRTMLRQSVDRMQSGHARASQASAAMGRLVEATGAVNANVAQIAAAAREQAQGIAQVNGAIEQLDQAVQANARLATHAFAEAEEMRLRAERLVAAVDRFDTGDAVGSALPANEPVLALQVA